MRTEVFQDECHILMERGRGKNENAAQSVSKSPFLEVLHITFSTFHEQKVFISFSPDGEVSCSRTTTIRSHAGKQQQLDDGFAVVVMINGIVG